MEYRKLSELNKLEGNPRIIRDARFMDLCASLKKNPRFFEARPLILSDRTGKLVVIAGNQKFEAAKACKLEKVPTFLISGLTEELEREIIIRDNAHAGEWDFDVLAKEWSELPLAEWGVVLPEDWSVGVGEVGPPLLQDGDRPHFQQMTFTLHDDQVEEVKAALTKAKANGGATSETNENSNGNALAHIAEAFNRG